MNNERYNQIIDEVWSNYRTAFVEGHVHQELDKCLPIEEFIEEIKSDNEFSQEWGLHIEERELSLDERKTIYENEYTESMEVQNNHWLNSKLTTRNIPTKVITLIYNNEKIEIYE